MPTDYSNFSNQDNAIDPHAQTQAPGAAPAVWDPIAKRWVGSTSGPTGNVQQQQPGTTWDMQEKQYVPIGDARSDGTTNYEGTAARGDATTAGAVEGNSAIDGFNTGGSWGGSTGAMVRGPDGVLRFDGSQSGRAKDVDRLRGLGSAAAGRQAYQNNYGQANADSAYGAGARIGQGEAIGLARNTALEGSSIAQAQGRNMLQQGVQSQQAAAMSARGGGLAQAAAMMQQRNGQAAFMQRGNNELAAQRADQMEAGRAQYQQQLDAQRQQDAQSQGLHQSQATSQMANEIGQRELNQTGQMGYEGMAQNVNKAAQDAALKNRETEVGYDAGASLRGQRQADRELQQVGNVAATGGTLVAGLASMTEDEEKKKKDPDPWGSSGSDERMKSGVRPMSLGEAAARRQR